MLNLNQTILNDVIADALKKTENNPRWFRATQRAISEIETNPYLDEQDGGVLICSSTSFNVYSTDFECECAAFTYGKPCWHRALTLIVSRVREREAIAGHKSNVTQMPAPKTQTLVGTFVRAVVPDANDATGWTVKEGIVSRVEHRKFYSVITLRSGERFSSEYITRESIQEERMAA